MFFVISLTNQIIALYVAAAVLPAVFLMRYIYKKDTVEKESPRLLWACVGRGVLAVIASIVLETIGEAVLNTSGLKANTPAYTAVLAFLVVAVVEEGTKYFFMARLTWRNPEFNYRFDGIVYAAFTSLGFAALENIKYVFSFGLSVALPRAVLSIPGHLGFAVVFGVFYGRARYAANRRQPVKRTVNLIVGYILAVLLHGTYDFCAMRGTARSTGFFIGFVILMYIVIFNLIRHESWTDREIMY